jgi:FtsH-binding integral membrane protein
MNIVLWISQVLLALHTLMGAVWKFSHSEQTIPSLRSIPHSVWLGMSIIEIFCSIALVLPFFNKSWAWSIPLAAGYIAAEMLFFSSLHLRAAESDNSPVVYWLVVAAFCAFIIFGRLSLRPLQ